MKKRLYYILLSPRNENKAVLHSTQISKWKFELTGPNQILEFIFNIQSNLSYVTFQGNTEIWSYKTGGRLIQV
jgi:hypothetical protein